MSERFSLKDHLFNRDTIGQLGDEFAREVCGFPRDKFVDICVNGLAGRELLERLDWIADCLEPYLPSDFPKMAEALEAAMPPPLDPDLQDDDFGQFIHAVPGVLAVRHGLEDHPDRAFDLLHAATQRFSMEFYIRPFLERWRTETLARLETWAADPNYHVRRLVSEGTRARLPWAPRITLDPFTPLPLLNKLHADPTRYVTRSVANHLNDIAKIDADCVCDTLDTWHAAARQAPAELAWMTRHALRTLVKNGHPRALQMLGYRPDAPVTLERLSITPTEIGIGSSAEITLCLTAPEKTPVLVDYVLRLRKADGTLGAKVFKIKQDVINSGTTLELTKRHLFKGDATTYRLHPGPQEMALQVNGRILGTVAFSLSA